MLTLAFTAGGTDQSGATQPWPHSLGCPTNEGMIQLNCEMFLL
jgi:hypothetical protein